jgi:hypothetical protein
MSNRITSRATFCHKKAAIKMSGTKHQSVKKPRCKKPCTKHPDINVLAQKSNDAKILAQIVTNYTSVSQKTANWIYIYKYPGAKVRAQNARGHGVTFVQRESWRRRSWKEPAGHFHSLNLAVQLWAYASLLYCVENSGWQRYSYSVTKLRNQLLIVVTSNVFVTF